MCVHLCLLSRLQLFTTTWTVACQAPLSMGFSRQEYWSGVPCHPPGDLPDPGIELVSPALTGGFLPLSHVASTALILFWAKNSIKFLLTLYLACLLLKWKKVKVKSLSRVLLFVTPQTVAYQAPLSMGFSRQEYWSGLPFPSQKNQPNSHGSQESKLIYKKNKKKASSSRWWSRKMCAHLLLGQHQNHN